MIFSWPFSRNTLEALKTQIIQENATIDLPLVSTPKLVSTFLYIIYWFYLKRFALQMWVSFLFIKSIGQNEKFTTYFTKQFITYFITLALFILRCPVYYKVRTPLLWDAMYSGSTYLFIHLLIYLFEMMANLL